MPKKTISLGEITMTRLNQAQLAKVKKLEAHLGDVRLLAVDNVDAMFVLEAKMAPNVWIAVHQVYHDIPGLRSYFQDREEAQVTKAGLKDLLRQGQLTEEKKRPIRIRKL